MSKIVYDLQVVMEVRVSGEDEGVPVTKSNAGDIIGDALERLGEVVGSGVIIEVGTTGLMREIQTWEVFEEEGDEE